jgi:hypothetical protein
MVTLPVTSFMAAAAPAPCNAEGRGPWPFKQ